MSCAACSARVEKAVGGLKGVKSCNVSLLTNSMTVDGDISDKEIKRKPKKPNPKSVKIRLFPVL